MRKSIPRPVEIQAQWMREGFGHLRAWDLAVAASKQKPRSDSTRFYWENVARQIGEPEERRAERAADLTRERLPKENFDAAVQLLEAAGFQLNTSIQTVRDGSSTTVHYAIRIAGRSTEGVSANGRQPGSQPDNSGSIPGTPTN